MHGVLFRYGPAPAQVAFRSAPGAAPGGGASPHPPPPPHPPPRRHLVLVGGLTDGLLALPYAEALAAEAEGTGYTLVQAQLSSSYQVG
jgi:hypothetical protein